MADQLPDKIYLMPDDENGHVWADTPAPGQCMVAADATAYVKLSMIHEQVQKITDEALSDGSLSDDAADPIIKAYGAIVELFNTYSDNAQKK